MGTEAISINTKKNNIIEVIPEAKELGFVGIPDKIDIDVIKNDFEVGFRAARKPRLVSNQ